MSPRHIRRRARGRNGQRQHPCCRPAHQPWPNSHASTFGLQLAQLTRKIGLHGAQQTQQRIEGTPPRRETFLSCSCRRCSSRTKAALT